MIKKIVSYLCCLVPVTAMAVNIDEYNENCALVGGAYVCTPGTGNAVGAGEDNDEEYLTEINVPQTVVVKDGNGIRVREGGITLAGNMYVGQNAQGSDAGHLYIETATDPAVSINSDGDISVTGSLTVMNDKAGRKLSIFGNSSPINASFASIANGVIPEGMNNDATLTSGTILEMYNIGTLTSLGGVKTNGNLSLSAKTMNLGAIANNGGITNLTATGNIAMTQFITNSTGASTISAAVITNTGDIQANGGPLNVTTTTGMTVDGSVLNNGGTMTITGGDILITGNAVSSITGYVPGVLVNTGTMNLNNLSSLRVMGGDASNASLVNKGNFSATVSGNTHFENGWNLTSSTTNTFSLDTGTLTFGAGVPASNLLNMFSNTLNKFELTIRGGGITANDIVNGVNNSAANMTVNATSVTATGVRNSGGNLTLKATKAEDDTGGDITINGAVGAKTDLATSQTDILADGALMITGAVNNYATTTLSGDSVSLTSVTNNGNKLDILSKTSASGVINIADGVTANTGTTNINGRGIVIGTYDTDGNLISIFDESGNLISNGLVKTINGAVNIKGSDAGDGSAMKIGEIEVAGGSVRLDALAGTIDISKMLSVTGGVLNFGSETVGSSVTNVNVGGNVVISGNLTASKTDATGAGNVNVNTYTGSKFKMKSTDGSITIVDDLVATATDKSRTILLDAKAGASYGINIGGDVTAGGMGRLIFGETTATHLNVAGDMSSDTGGIIDLNVLNTTVGSLSNIATNPTSVGGRYELIGNGTDAMKITATKATDKAINLSGGVWFDGTNQSATTGMIVTGTNNLTLQTTAAGGGISIMGGAAIGSGKTLVLTSADQVIVSGAVKNVGTFDVNASGAATLNNAINNTGTLTVDGTSVTLSGITNSSTATLNATTGNLITGAITNTGTGVLTASGSSITATAISATGGGLDFTGNSLNMDSMTLSGTGTYANLNAASITSSGAISATGNLVQGGTTGMLNITKSNTLLKASDLTIGGNFTASQYSAEYTITNDFDVTGNITVANGASVKIGADSISMVDVTNRGNLSLNADTVQLGDVLNYASLDINSGTSNLMTIDSLTTTSASGTKLAGIGLTSVGNIDLAGRLLQNATGTASNGDVNVVSNNYAISAGRIETNGIGQTSGKMTLNTNDLNVGERDVDGNITKVANILATDLRVIAKGNDWLTVDVTGNVSGGVDFIGLERMTVGGNYIFDDNSILMAAILDRGVTTHNYWATVSLAEDKTLGTITNGANAEPLISINGKFISQMDINNPNMYYEWNNSTVGEIKDGQMGVYITDIVDQGSAIWLIHADGGIEDDGKKLRNAVVRFCNADGSICYNYLDSLKNGSTDEDDLPVYLSARDTDGDGEPDSWYLVFDPRFGGPVELFKIQPIVDREDVHTDGEYFTAGALDDLLVGRLHQTGFYNRTPIELVPEVFKNTNMAEMSKELYDRMEQYILDRNGAGLARFSRLFQPREIEQVAGSVVLNEHTTFRDFEDRMFDEFIWNRNRSLKKAWIEADFGMYNQKVMDDKKVSGNRFSVQGGFDWQDSDTLIMGLSGHVSHMSGTNNDEMDLGYKPNQHIAGRIDLEVATTNIGIGGYIMKTLGTKARLYGNAFLDLHLFDITRDQNFVDNIDGSGTAFSLITEWGLMHDWLNQYIVGNVYARAGYNFGFDVTEKADGGDYMNLESDGYLILTPGYSLTAQKRIYTSPWFQMRPYLTVGAEYDVLGAPDEVQFKFAYANKFTDYEVNIDPLWVNGGGGIEFLGASGFQFGIDYRYQYNADIQMHKIKLSGSYRF